MIRKILLSLSLIFAVLYSCTWFYASVHYKKLIKKSIEKINSEHLNFSYDELHVKNFPFSPTINIDHPKLIFTNKNQTNIYKFDQLNICSNLLLNKFDIKLSKEIIHETGDQKYIVQYNEPVGINIAIHKTLLFKNLADSLTMLKLLKNINFVAKDFTINDKDSNNIIYKYDYNKFHISHDISNFNHSILFTSNIKGTSQTASDGLGPQEFNLKVNLKLKANPKNIQEFNEYDIDFENMSFTSEKFNINIQGNGKGTENDILPSGEIKITINKLYNLLNYLSVNNIIKNENKILSIVEQTADKTDENETLLTIKRQEKGNFYLGNLTFSHILFSLIGSN
ncbi:MAG: hypothetical protein ACK4OM_04470 [Alphaproteobacteria bacterium]